jgi:hypothetical protein
VIDQAAFDYVSDPERPRPNAAAEGILFGVPGNEAMMRDPRSPRFCAKLGFCADWVKTERWLDCAESGVLPYDFKAECWRLVAAQRFRFCVADRWQGRQLRGFSRPLRFC